MPNRSHAKLAPKPREIDPAIGVNNLDAIADGLAGVLSDTYALVVRTHAVHWNVVGPLFYGAHNLTEEQYGEMFQAADEIAERIRALGRFAPGTFAAFEAGAKIGEQKGAAGAKEMIAGLVESHEALARRLHELIRTAGEGDDAVTEDLATQRAAFHEKAAWMLRAVIAD